MKLPLTRRRASDDDNPAAVGAPRDREVIALVGLAHGTSHFFHLMLPPLFSWLMRDFSLSYTDARVSRLRTCDRTVHREH